MKIIVYNNIFNKYYNNPNFIVKKQILLVAPVYI